nr:hypothetical protein [Anaerolineae bacterium]NIN93642.1 hypothetical protein [Anaerolineae bacterium]
VYVPASSANDWKEFLAKPDRQWKAGYSAHALAHAWQEADGFPESVRRVLAKSGRFTSIELLLAIPEHQVALPGGRTPSQSDLWVLARTDSGLVSMAVEGKVAEPFGPTVQDWLSDASSGKRKRLKFIRSLLELEGMEIGPIRYQLLHRTASAVLEAPRFHAVQSMMMVHSFSAQDEGFDDYRDFVSLFGAAAELNEVTNAGAVSGTELFFAWVRGSE